MQPSPPAGDDESPEPALSTPPAEPRSGRRRAPSRREEARVRKGKEPRRARRQVAPSKDRAGSQRRIPEGPFGAERKARARAEATSFDDFYLGTRRRVLMQSLALTGDLEVSRAAVRDAYVAAYHHWRKVGRMADPESWVRPQAWSRARRRAKAHPLRREKDLDPGQTEVLDGLSRLSDAQRRTLLLTHLAALPMDDIGRELAIPRTQVEHHLQQGTAQFALDIKCESTNVRPRLESLAPVVTSPGLPRVTTIRRSGVRRRRWHLFGGAALALALAAGSGWFVSTQAPAPSAAARRALEHPVTAAMLLSTDDLAPIASTGWRTTSTGPNTTGTGLHSPCQSKRFADTRGLGAWVRTFSGPRGRQAVQAVEVSASPGATQATYARSVSWYASCVQARAHLNASYRVSGLGDEAVALDLSTADGDRYLVTVARAGQTTQTTLLHSPVPRDRIHAVDQVALAAMRGVCRSGAITHCRANAATATPHLLPSGAPPGMLATIDLPLLAGVDDAWIGTEATRGKVNLAATPCDNTKFIGGGRKPRTRSFLVPNAPLPVSFGITEIYAAFHDAKAATTFARGISKRMRSCEDRNLGSEVTAPFTGHGIAGWHVTSEINAKRKKVAYWMGIIRVGQLVGQVGFTPTDKVDVTKAQFVALMKRARDRLAARSGNRP